MKKPRQRGGGITQERISAWVASFRFYRHPPDEQAIKLWLGRFQNADKDIAARVLDCVDVVSEQQILIGYRDSLRGVPGWHANPARRSGNWYFVGFGHAGESGPSMVRQFREANKLNDSRHDELFCAARDLPAKRLTAYDHVIFIDDFSGSGKQVCDAWPLLQELVASEAKCYLILTAITKFAIDKIRQSIPLALHYHIDLKEEDNVFHPACKHFSVAEKAVIERYGKRADRTRPKGWGDCGLLFILSHKTPNNTIPILHANHAKWSGLFPRYLPLPG